MKRPSSEDMLLAAEWLDENEGDPDESEPMKRVAEWLRFQVKKNEEYWAVREIALQSGVSISAARKALHKITKTK
jgi:hypothetical protein